MHDDPGYEPDQLAIERSLGDPARFAVVFERHFATIHGYLARRVGTATADDLAGEAFRIAFEGRRRFDHRYESALPWLYGIATNLLRNHRRSEARQLDRRSRVAMWEPASLAAGPEDRVAAIDGAAATARALRALPDADRDALVLFAVEELSYAEVALALGIPIGTVRSRISRARHRMRELLGPLGQGPTDRPTTEEVHHG